MSAEWRAGLDGKDVAAPLAACKGISEALLQIV
jgi:hypothetical protein